MRPAGLRRARAEALLEALRPTLEHRLAGRMPARDVAATLARVGRHVVDVYEALDVVYGDREDVEALLTGLLGRVAEAAVARPEDLRTLDHRREINPGWHLDERAVGYVAYTDRFAGTLAGVGEHVDYLRELGVSYLHLMPLLAPRPGPNDGGYSVADYRCVDPRLGSMDDLEQLARRLRAAGISLCIDLVVNHTAREHAWAQQARAGDQRHRDYYLTYPDRTAPDRFERDLRDVFPHTAPGSFTWVPEMAAWVWTTFYDHQWDLNYANPAVFGEMLDIMLFLANRGVEVLRLDAVPFLWKREGTDCQNQPEVHALLQAFRGLVSCAAPALTFKAEAIVGPDELVQYLGAHDRHRPECELAYNNQLMVLSWSSVASRDTRLMASALARMRRPPPATTWVTYVRGHDDIGWAVADTDAAAVGSDGWSHRRFLSDFFSGAFPGSYARGEVFQLDPVTGDARISGTTASLCGVEQALELADEALLDAAIRRLLLLHALSMSYGGVPLLYMGDELALRNDRTYAQRAEQSGDNRWLHRPAMDWQVADRRHRPGTPEQRVFTGLAHLLAVRRSLPTLRSGGSVQPLHPDNPRIFAFLRDHPRTGRFLGLVNVGDAGESCRADLVFGAGLRDPYEALTGAVSLPVSHGRLHLPPLQMFWLTED